MHRIKVVTTRTSEAQVVVERITHPGDTVAVVRHLNHPAVLEKAAPHRHKILVGMEVAARHHPNNLKAMARAARRVAQHHSNPEAMAAMVQPRNTLEALPEAVRRIDPRALTIATPVPITIPRHDNRKVTPTEISPPRIKPKTKELHPPIDAVKEMCMVNQPMSFRFRLSNQGLVKKKLRSASPCLVTLSVPIPIVYCC